MADDLYQLTYLGNASNFVSEANKAEAALKPVDSLADRLKKKLKGLFSGVNAGPFVKSLQGVATNATAANAALGSVAKSATTAGGSMATAAAQTATARTALTSIASRGDKAAAALGSVATNATAAGTAIGTIQPVAVSATKSSNRLTAAFGGMSAAMIAMRAGHEVLQAIHDGLKDAREDAEQTAVALGAVRKELTELKAIRGDKTIGQTTEAIKKLMLETNASFEEAKAFETTFGSGVGMAKKSGNLTMRDKEIDEMKSEILSFGLSQGMDPAAMGKVMSMVGMVQPIGTKDEMRTEIARIQHAGMGAAGTFKEMDKGAIKTLAKEVGPKGAFRTAGELYAGLQSMTAQGPPGQAPAGIRQIGSVLGVAKNKESQAIFDKFKIKPGMDLEEKIQAIAPWIEAMPNPEQGMKDAGFGNLASNKQVIAAVKNKKIWAANKKAALDLSDPGFVTRAVEEHRREQPRRAAEAAREVAELNVGETKERLSVLQSFAETGMMNRGEIPTKGKTPTEYLYGMAEMFGAEPLRTSKTDFEIKKRLNKQVGKERAKELGVSVPTAETSEAEVTKIINKLTPEEFETLRSSMEAEAKAPATVGMKVGAAGVGGAPVGGPLAMAGAGAASDPALLRENQRQTDLQRTMVAALTGRPGASTRSSPPVGRLPTDSDDSGYERA